ncbi:glyoxalase [Bermanella sp. 47_1433_sub80_T6]|nr:glyoxalase [Bermanella sp. 47_1433_sub80_T6]
MIGYTTLGTNNFEKSGAFYDGLLAELGARRVVADDHIIVWSNKPGAAMLAVIKPHDGKEATVGNGGMVALVVKDLAMIETLHKKALELGGTCEGEPGKRTDTMSFGYVRDLDGNKLAFYCMN